MISDVQIRLRNRIKTNSLIKSRDFRNVVKCSFSPAEKAPHRNIKWIIASWCYDNQIEFYTEVIMRKGRSDVILPDFGIGLEILNTETIKKFETKNYNIPIIPIRTTTPKKEIIEMLEEFNATNGTCWEYYFNKYTKNDRYNNSSGRL